MIDKKVTVLILSGFAAGVGATTWFCGGPDEPTQSTTTISNAEQAGGVPGAIAVDAAQPVVPALARTTPPGLPPVPSPPCTSCPPELRPNEPGRTP